MARIAGVTRRIGAPILLGVLVAPLLSVAPSMAESPGTQPATVEAVCPTATPGTAQCLALRRTDIASSGASGVSPDATSSFYRPADLRTAYALPTGTQGSGLTVAVVDAYDLPTAEATLATYRSSYGLPACTTANGCFRKVDQDGGTSYPAANAGWGIEIALDIDMVSATCPHCNILLVEASNSTLTNLGQAVNTAVSMGAVAVSNSYGGQESSAETYWDTYYNHPGVAITASTGDCGYHCAGSGYNSVEYPAASQYVVAVGGTTLTPNSSARGYTESAWGGTNGGAGSGCSAYEPKPSWQSDTGCTMRTQADVSAVADPQTGVWVYASGGWGVYGGTSVAAPIIAAVFALAGGPAPGAYPASYLYAGTAHLNDAIGGNNDVKFHSCTITYLCNGIIGYDGPTGLGTPNGTGAFVAPSSATAKTTYHAITPVRLVDTREGNGLPTRLSANTPATFHVTGRFAIPTNATAVTGNVTVVYPTYSWALYLGPNPRANPSTSTLNFLGGEVKANGVTVALGSGGTLSATYISYAGNTTDLVFDVTGYYTPDKTGATYHAMTPARLVDSRQGHGLSTRLSANIPATFPVTNRSGIPTTAIAVTGNVTVVNPTYSWAIYLGPDPIASPGTSTLNFLTGEAKANGVTVALGSGGTLSATYMSVAGNTTDLVFDVTGYYTNDLTGARYVPLAPVRLLDSRYGNGLSTKLSANTPATFQVTGRAGIPATAIAVTGNVTVVNPTSSWAIYLGPDPIASPGT